jgi:hypothetical protein
LLAEEMDHAVLEKDLHAGFARRRRQRAHKAVARGGGVAHALGGRSGLHHRPVHDGAVVLARDGIADRAAAPRVGRPLDEHDAMRDEKIESRNVVVGESADELAIVVAIIGEAIRLDDAPVGEVAEEEIGRVGNAIFLLSVRAAAQRHISAAADRVAADMRLRLDDDDRASCLARDDRRRNARGTAADDHDVRQKRPFHRRWLALCQSGFGQDASGERRRYPARLQHVPPADGHDRPPMLCTPDLRVGASQPPGNRVGGRGHGLPHGGPRGKCRACRPA